LTRAPDPQLEQRVAKAALRLLDAGGVPAITLRAVAREARTTTPSIYGRFTNRDKLLQSMKHEAGMEAVGAVRRARNTSDFIKRVVEFGLRHPRRLELIVDAFGSRLAANQQPMPVYELLKEQLTEETGVQGTKREQLAMAVASLALGTTRGMIAAGNDTPMAKDLYRTCLGALQLLLKAFSGLHTIDSNRSALGWTGI